METVTYSPAYTLVPTYECFNRCGYCNFRKEPGQDQWLKLSEAKRILTKLKPDQICEILILSGEVHPRSPRRQDWFEHICQLCQLALTMGFLPHANVGPLSRVELARLSQLNASMGLMLEQLSPELQQTVHQHAPSKEAALRLQQLTWAGELRIPFTTGLLLGIGESPQQREKTLGAIANIQGRWGHIQEVILQPYQPGTQQSGDLPGFPLPMLPEIVAQARRILPSSITLQIPPNLILEPAILKDCLQVGVRDLGGIVPKDEVNPDYIHWSLADLRAITTAAGYDLKPRLPVYPAHVDRLTPRLKSLAQTWQQRYENEAISQASGAETGLNTRHHQSNLTTTG